MAGGSNVDFSGTRPLCLCEFSRHLPKKSYENDLLDYLRLHAFSVSTKCFQVSSGLYHSCSVIIFVSY